MKRLQNKSNKRTRIILDYIKKSYWKIKTLVRLRRRSVKVPYHPPHVSKYKSVARFWKWLTIPYRKIRRGYRRIKAFLRKQRVVCRHLFAHFRKWLKISMTSALKSAGQSYSRMQGWISKQYQQMIAYHPFARFWEWFRGLYREKTSALLESVRQKYGRIKELLSKQYQRVIAYHPLARFWKWLTIPYRKVKRGYRRAKAFLKKQRVVCRHLFAHFRKWLKISMTSALKSARQSYGRVKEWVGKQYQKMIAYHPFLRFWEWFKSLYREKTVALLESAKQKYGRIKELLSKQYQKVIAYHPFARFWKWLTIPYRKVKRGYRRAKAFLKKQRVVCRHLFAHFKKELKTSITRALRSTGQSYSRVKEWVGKQYQKMIAYHPFARFWKWLTIPYRKVRRGYRRAKVFLKKQRVVCRHLFVRFRKGLKTSLTRALRSAGQIYSRVKGWVGKQYQKMIAYHPFLRFWEWFRSLYREKTVALLESAKQKYGRIKELLSTQYQRVIAYHPFARFWKWLTIPYRKVRKGYRRAKVFLRKQWVVCRHLFVRFRKWLKISYRKIEIFLEDATELKKGNSRVDGFIEAELCPKKMGKNKQPYRLFMRFWKRLRIAYKKMGSGWRKIGRSYRRAKAFLGILLEDATEICCADDLVDTEVYCESYQIAKDQSDFALYKFLGKWSGEVVLLLSIFFNRFWLWIKTPFYGSDLLVCWLLICYIGMPAIEYVRSDAKGEVWQSLLSPQGGEGGTEEILAKASLEPLSGESLLAVSPLLSDLPLGWEPYTSFLAYPYKQLSDLFSTEEAEDGLLKELFSPSPPAQKERPCGSGCKDSAFSFWASFIYWQPMQDFMDVGLESERSLTNSQCGMSWTGGKRVEMNTAFAPGFILNAVYSLPGWDIFAEYAYFHTTNTVSKSAPANSGFLFARWIQPGLISNNSVTHLSTQWDLNIDILNLEMGRRYYTSKFMWTPHVGVAAARIRQEFRGGFSLLSPSFPLTVKNESSSWGIGPRIGIEGNLCLTRDFGLVGNVATDILFTHYDLTLHQFSPTDSTIFIRSSNTINALRVELDMFLGLEYRVYSSKKWCVTLQAGYDFQVWWNQNMMRWNNDSTYMAIPEGNLYLQGGSFTAKIEF